MSRGKARWSRKSFRDVDMHIEELAKARELAQREREARALVAPVPEEFLEPTPEPTPPPHWQRRESVYRPSALTPDVRKYELHNPTGPRWYINHHLLPPKTGVRPPSLFSPNFPAFPSTPFVPAPQLDSKARHKATTFDHRPAAAGVGHSGSAPDKPRRASSMQPAGSPGDEARGLV